MSSSSHPIYLKSRKGYKNVCYTRKVFNTLWHSRCIQKKNVLLIVLEKETLQDDLYESY